MTINYNRDDHQLDRLFFHLTDCFNFPLKSLKKINDKVYLINFINDEHPLVIKKFPTYNKLKKQKLLTDYLVLNGFPTYTFMQRNDYLFREQNSYYAILQYLPKHEQVFTFDKENDRISGLNLLNHFHKESRKFAGMLTNDQLTIFPKLNLEERWYKRLDFFLSQEKIITNYIPLEYFREITYWSQWALLQMGDNKRERTLEEHAIIHGDVAHHNFLRAVNNRLYLIDFDLTAYAYPVYDYVQYALRTISFMNWNLDQLFTHKVYEKYKENRWFLSALTFPNEIIREWNQLIRLGKYHHEKWLTYGVKLALSRFPGQQYVFNRIRNMLS
ncbi:phosphotransferase [Bacillus kwashiorkori]|uniref:phosphotransferase n=1 Tax=Bacillus kwashiorkori TaxID=1522318 RepID=UPI000782C023|nr:phosphotransferase [Bacillus kwashiorkori]